MGILKSSRVMTAAQVNDITTDHLTQTYFSFLHKIFRKNYLENSSNYKNLTVCFTKKRFDTGPRSQQSSKIITTKRNKYINWFDFFYNYLIKEEKNDVEWAGKVLDLFENEYFLHENDYLSSFFFEEFKMKTIPDVIKEINIIEKPVQKAKNNSSTSDMNITKHYGGSFIISKKEDYGPNAPEIEYIVSREKIKEYVSIFKEHVYQNNHPINIVIKKFESVFSKYLKQKIQFLNKQIHQDKFEISKNEIMKEIKKSVVRQLQRFLLKVESSLKLFYAKTLNYSLFQDEKDDLINLIISLVFETGDIYDNIFELYSIYYKDDIHNFSEKISKSLHSKPQDFGIQQKFCLEEKGVSISRSSNIINNSNCSIELVLEEKSISNKDKIKDEADVDQINTHKEFNDYIIPYESAIKQLIKIKNFKAPFEKMMILAKLSDKITESINNYWKGKEVDPSFLQIDADELMSIITYIIMKAQINDLVVHLNIIHDFTTTLTKSSLIGYYFSSVDAALSNIREQPNIEEFFANEKIKKENENEGTPIFQVI